MVRALIVMRWICHPSHRLVRVKQWELLRAGALTQPLHMFDVVMHAAPTLLLLLHLGARWRARQRAPASAQPYCGE